MTRRVLRALTAPVRDTLDGLEACLVPEKAGAPLRLLVVFAGLAVGWWLYVPLHELLHAWGCLATGGTVDRLEIARLYGGGVLEGWVPFVTAGSDYAGQLTGFDTHGHDGIYLATVVAPFALTVLGGVAGLRWAGRRGQPWLFGMFLPVALAPFISWTGDAYEIGSIVISRLPPWSTPPLPATLRGDDVFVQATAWSSAGLRGWVGGLLSLLIGMVWASATYSLGRLLPTPAVERGVG